MVNVPIPCRVIEQPIWHQYTFTPNSAGSYSGSILFFNTDTHLGRTSNVHNGSLPPHNWFKIKKIYLSAERSSSFQDLIDGSYFTFVIGQTSLLSGPAEMLLRGNVQEFNQIVSGLKKLPKSEQLAILKNMKMAEGKVFENPIELLCLQNFRVEFHTPQPVKLKKPIMVQCTLDGTYYRPLLA